MLVPALAAAVKAVATQKSSQQARSGGGRVTRAWLSHRRGLIAVSGWRVRVARRDKGDISRVEEVCRSPLMATSAVVVMGGGEAWDR